MIDRRDTHEMTDSSSAPSLAHESAVPSPVRQLTIIIPCSDDDSIARCLDSIDSPVEVLVVLNGATASVRRIAAANHAHTVEISERNLGKAFDIGVTAAPSDLVLLMNSDCVFESGAISKFLLALELAPIVKGPIDFKHSGYFTWLVAKHRECANQRQDGTPHLYNPGLAFDRRIIDSIGYYFDHDIHWTEDADFERRVVAAQLQVRFDPSATVHHDSLTPHQDLRSAFRYGIGRRIAEEKSLIGTRPPHWAKARSLLISEIRNGRRFGTAIFVYGLIWQASFAMGYLWQITRDPYRVRSRRLTGTPK